MNETNRRESIVEEEDSSDNKVQGKTGRRVNALMTYGKMDLKNSLMLSFDSLSLE